MRRNASAREFVVDDGCVASPNVIGCVMPGRPDSCPCGATLLPLHIVFSCAMSSYSHMFFFRTLCVVFIIFIFAYVLPLMCVSSCVVVFSVILYWLSPWDNPTITLSQKELHPQQQHTTQTNITHHKTNANTNTNTNTKNINDNHKYKHNNK